MIPRGHYISKRCTSDDPLEFGCTCGFFSCEFLWTFFVLSSVEDSPIYVPMISLGKEYQLAFCVKKLENFPVGPGIEPPGSRIDLRCAQIAELHLHSSSSQGR